MFLHIAVAAVACTGTASRDVEAVDTAPSQTLASVASVGPLEVAIVGSFANATSTPVFLAHCDRDVLVAVERQVTGEEWREVPRDPCPAYLQPPTKVAPGETRTFRVILRLGSLLSPEEQGGVFRVLVAAHTDSAAAAEAGGAALLDASLRRSPPFTVSR
jgi:hypothetical protein